MMWTVAIILLVLWLLGQLTSYTMGGTIHLLLVLGLVVVLVQVFRGNGLTAR